MCGKFKTYILFSLLVVLLTSCYTTNQNIISKSADISKYKIAAIHEVMDYTGSPALMDLDVKIFEIMSQAGIEMIGEREIRNNFV